jgi:C4-dicarboxylate transporter DctM subunit
MDHADGIGMLRSGLQTITPGAFRPLSQQRTDGRHQPHRLERLPVGLHLSPHLPGVEVQVQDADDNPAKPGETGELMVKKGEAWFPTKDLGRVDEDGYFYHGGRADDVIISAGWTIGAVEIEDAVLERSYYHSASGFILVAIPLFILMAHLLTVGDVTRRAFIACRAWIGHARGGLAMAAVGASVLLTALIGSSTASTAAMATAAFPEMGRYSDKLAAAVVSVGGTLAVVVPPSIVLVVYGVLTETSIGSLFIAGIVPGLLTALGLIAVVRFTAVTTELAPKGPPFQFRRAVRESSHIWPISILIVLVIGAIYGGLASPSEAAAFGVLGALVLGVAQRTINAKGFSRAVSSAIKSTVMIVAIIACSSIFANYLAFTRVTHTILDVVNGSDLPRYHILMLLVLALLLMGMLMDQLAILSLTMPLAFPAIMALKFDPVWFGIIVTKTAEIGLLTPPSDSMPMSAPARQTFAFRLFLRD